MDGNFKCNTCGREFFEPMYTIEYRAGGLPIYRNSVKQKIICPECRSEDIESIVKSGGVPFYGKFSSSSPEDKREMLRKRSEIHSKREADKRNYINKGFSKRFGGK